MKVSVEADKCVCAGSCVVAAPDVFDQREEDGVVVVLDDSPPPAAHEGVWQAAMLCPASAIQVTES
jgi:ferredoxin